MIKIKYVFQRGGSYYWQRKVPVDLADRYPSSGPLKVNLQTTDPAVIAAKVGRLNREHDALWAALRNDPALSPQSARDAAGALLKSHGLPPTGKGPDEGALSLFYDRLNDKRAAYADRQEEPEDHSFFDLEPNRCITELKRLCPTAGRFYGSLSGLAHVHPSHTPEYLDFDGPRTAVLLRISHLRWAAVFDLLKLADWFHLVGEYVVFDHLAVPQSIRRNQDGALCVHSKRPFVREIIKHAQAAKAVGAPIKIEN